MRADMFILIDRDCPSRASLRLALGLSGLVRVFDGVEQIGPRLAASAWILVNDRAGQVEATLAQLEREAIYCPVLAYSDRTTTDRVVRLLHNGALGYFDWPSSIAQLRETIATLRPMAGERRAAMTAAYAARTRVAQLTTRELQVLRAVGEGLVNKLIARTLAISPRTVEIHRANAIRKLEAANSYEAVHMIHAAAAVTGVASAVPGAGIAQAA